MSSDVEKHDATSFGNAAVPVIVSVDRCVELIVAADGCQQQPAFRQTSCSGISVDGKFGAFRVRVELALVRIVGKIKSAGLSNARIILGKPGHHMLDVLANAIIIFNQIPSNPPWSFAEAPRRQCPQQSPARSANAVRPVGGFLWTYARRRWCLPPRRIVRHALFWKSRSVRPRHGSRISACSPVIKCTRFSLVEICTVNLQRWILSDVYLVSGVAAKKFPPKPIKTFTLPLFMASIVRTVS